MVSEINITFKEFSKEFKLLTEENQLYILGITQALRYAQKLKKPKVTSIVKKNGIRISYKKESLKNG